MTSYSSICIYNIILSKKLSLSKFLVFSSITSNSRTLIYQGQSENCRSADLMAFFICVFLGKLDTIWLILGGETWAKEGQI